ncbi:MAG: hypothetical protein QOF33_643 [Thermomicrobiales bacterium]|jgi:hypothetical protein|nr:hypothetical protein [Thermomicrobiales bacterium]
MSKPPRKRANVYFDGFNVYHGCFRDGARPPIWQTCKWLDLKLFCERVFPNFDIYRIRYFTALVNPTPIDPDNRLRQQTYLRALETIPNLTVHRGRFATNKKKRWLADPRSSKPTPRLPLQTAEVIEQDVLEKGMVQSKVKVDPIATLAAKAHAEDSLKSALEVHNLVVHGGVQIPTSKPKPHIQAMALFVLDHGVTAIRQDCPALPRPEFVYAYEELMGRVCPPEIEALVQTYLVGAGLLAKRDNHKAEPQHPRPIEAKAERARAWAVSTHSLVGYRSSPPGLFRSYPPPASPAPPAGTDITSNPPLSRAPGEG